MNRSKQLRQLAFQALAENNIDVLEKFMHKDADKKKDKRKQAAKSRKRNRKK